MLNAIKRFVRDESGLETVEWAIVGGLVVAVGAIVFTLIGGDVKTSLNNLQDGHGQGRHCVVLVHSLDRTRIRIRTGQRP